MTSEQQAAFVIAQSVAAFAEIEGMKITNFERIQNGYAPAYDEEAFLAVSNRYGLHQNALIGWFH